MGNLLAGTMAIVSLVMGIAGAAVTLAAILWGIGDALLDKGDWIVWGNRIKPKDLD